MGRGQRVKRRRMRRRRGVRASGASTFGDEGGRGAPLLAMAKGKVKSLTAIKGKQGVARGGRASDGLHRLAQQMEDEGRRTRRGGGGRGEETEGRRRRKRR